MTRRKWDRTDTKIAALALFFVAWCGGWAYVACHFIRKWW